MPPVIPAAHPSFPRSLSPTPTPTPTPIGERESIPPHTRLSRESGNPYVLNVGLPLDKPKVHGKTGVVAKTKGLWLAGEGLRRLRCAEPLVRIRPTRLGRVVVSELRLSAGQQSRFNEAVLLCNSQAWQAKLSGLWLWGVRKPLFHGIALGRVRRGRRGNQEQRIGIALDSGPTRFLRVCLAGPQVNPLSGHTGRITSHFATMKTLRCCHPLAADCR